MLLSSFQRCLIENRNFSGELKCIKRREEGLEDSIKDVENGQFSVVYAMPDALLLTERWRSMLASPLYSTRLCAVVVDEAHEIKQW